MTTDVDFTKPDYLTVGDKKRLESIGYMPYKGAYGFKAREDAPPIYRIVGVIGDMCLVELTHSGGGTSITTYSINALKCMCVKNLGPRIPDEIHLVIEKFTPNVNGTYKDGEGKFYANSFATEYLSQIMDNKQTNEFELILRRKKV